MEIEQIINIIKNIRKRRNITQDKMAERLKISKMQYSNYETLRSQMSLKMFMDIIKILEISPSDFFNDNENDISTDEIKQLVQIVDVLKQKKGL